MRRPSSGRDHPFASLKIWMLLTLATAHRAPVRCFSTILQIGVDSGSIVAPYWCCNGVHRMTLRDWLDTNGKSNAQFGEIIGRTAEAVRRYAAGDRIPDRETMPLIVEATGGKVTPN